MRQLFFTLITCMSLFSCNAAHASAPNITGYWQTIDDHTHQPTAIVQIYSQNNLIYGKVIAGYPVNGVVPHGTCPNCPAPFTNQPVIGMRILWNMSYNPQTHEYEGGQILDPGVGHIYQALLTPSVDGQSLKVRGYIDVPLLGRTQTWYRLAHS